MNKYAIIVAGGKGTRMGSETPKQFLEIHGKPILVHTIKAFEIADPATSIILVLPADQMERWGNLAQSYGMDQVQVVQGGAERFDSVRNGLDAIKDSAGIVAVHDAVRPCINPDIISRSFDVAEKQGSAVVCVKSKDSLRRIEETGSKAVDRSLYYLVQTPQVFAVKLLKLAYQKAVGQHFTDDASVVDHYGTEVVLVEGDYKNIKVTTPEDLAVAALYLK